VRIVCENTQTDLNIGLLTIEDDQGRRKRYVRRDKNATLKTRFELFAGKDRKPEFACMQFLERGILPDSITIAIAPRFDTDSAASAPRVSDLMLAHEYRADEQGFHLWEQFQALKSGEVPPDFSIIKKKLNDAFPDRDWLIAEMEHEWVRWCRDKRNMERAEKQ
jgi:hypothetical protein